MHKAQTTQKYQTLRHKTKKNNNKKTTEVSTWNDQ